MPDNIFSQLPLTGSFIIEVQIFDTDCYGVMWHGAYTKWLEMARVKFLEEQGITLSQPNDPEGYIYPVIEQSVVFKSPARFGDRLILTTQLYRDGYKLVFKQTCVQQNSQKTVIEAVTTCVVLNAQWKLQRVLPEGLNRLGEKMS